MSLGFPTDKNTVDQRCAAVALNLRETLNQVANIKIWLDGQTDTALQNLGYSAGEVTTLRAAYTDLDNLRKVATAQGTQASANDFFFNAKKLLGLQ
jgi:hypothetical protein